LARKEDYPFDARYCVGGQSGMGDHFLFFHNVSAHLVALMSGIVSFGIGIWEKAKKNSNPIHARAFWIIAALCLIVAFDEAWQDEHRNAQVVIAEKALEVSAKGNSDAAFNSCVGMPGLDRHTRKVSKISTMLKEVRLIINN